MLKGKMNSTEFVHEKDLIADILGKDFKTIVKVAQNKDAQKN